MSSGNLHSGFADSNISFRANVDGARLSTIGIGGVISCLYEPRSIDEVKSLVTYLSEQEKEILILGNGSNILIPDSGILTPIISLSQLPAKFDLLGDSSLESICPEPDVLLQILKDIGLKNSRLVHVTASLPLMKFCQEVCKSGLSGLEFAAGIPATMGGALWMNAGAHGKALFDVVRALYVIYPSGEMTWVAVNDLPFGYRYSGLPRGTVVLGAVLELEFDDLESVLNRRAAALAYRKRTQPLQLPSLGSIFRNPSQCSKTEYSGNVPHESKSAGALVEEIGYKGMRDGGVAFSTLHANWIVRLEKQASSDEVKRLICKASKEVRSRFGIELEREIIYW